MKSNRQFWIFLVFILALLLPLVPIVKSFVEIRSSVVVDQEIQWKEGEAQNFILNPKRAGPYEVRIESRESKWEPVLKGSWQLKQSDTVVSESLGSVEWNMTRPVTHLRLPEAGSPLEFSIKFDNSNPEKYPTRIRISQDRGLLLQKASREFSIFLALSLVVTMLLWRPLFRAPVRPANVAN